jgi:hypothetical protein
MVLTARRIIVAKAPTLRMNDTIDPADIEAAYADDPVRRARNMARNLAPTSSCLLILRW